MSSFTAYVKGWMETDYPSWLIADLVMLEAQRIVDGGFIETGENKRRSIPKKLRAFIIDRDNGICVYCKCDPDKLVIDHIFPVSRGGTNEPGNLCVACWQCNSRKAAKVKDWFQ